MEPSSLLAAFLVPDLRGDASIPHVLQQIAELCAHMQESCMVCLRVHARLLGLWQRELQFAPTASALRQRVVPVITSFGELLVRFRSLLRKFATDDRVFRLILNRQLFVKLDQLHRDLDAMQVASGSQQHEELLMLLSALGELKLGRMQWEADRKVQLQLDRHRSGYITVIQKELWAIAESDEHLNETLSQVRYAIATKLKVSGAIAEEAEGDSKKRQVVVLVFDNKQDATGKPALTITDWSLAPRVQVDNVIDNYHNSAAHSEDQEAANTDDSKLQQSKRWSGSRLFRSHSTCHLCTPVAFAFKDTTKTSRFAESFLTNHRAELVALLYKVELSLHFPHENELFNSSNRMAKAKASASASLALRI